MALTNIQRTRIIELWHLSRTALSDRVPSRFDRMQWVARHFDAEFTGFSHKQTWLAVDEQTRVY
jgi:hypothetical protein